MNATVPGKITVGRLKFEAPKPKRAVVLVIDRTQYEHHPNPDLAKLVDKTLLNNPQFRKVSLTEQDFMASITYYDRLPLAVTGDLPYVDWDEHRAKIAH